MSTILRKVRKVGWFEYFYHVQWRYYFFMFSWWRPLLNRILLIKEEVTKAVLLRWLSQRQHHVINLWHLVGISRGGSRRVAKLLWESNTFHIKSKSIKMLSCKDFATLLDPLLHLYKATTADLNLRCLENVSKIMTKLLCVRGGK